MTDPATPAPSAEEVAAAEAVLARSAAAAKAPLRELVAMDGFRAVLERAAALRGTFTEGTAFYAHLNAMVVGMGNLANDAA